MDIDSKSTIPISWFFGGIGAIVSIVVAGALWMSSVDYRLGRIEEKLGIPPYEASNIITSAFAK